MVGPGQIGEAVYDVYPVEGSEGCVPLGSYRMRIPDGDLQILTYSSVTKSFGGKEPLVTDPQNVNVRIQLRTVTERYAGCTGGEPEEVSFPRPEVIDCSAIPDKERCGQNCIRLTSKGKRALGRLVDESRPPERTVTDCW